MHYPFKKRGGLSLTVTKVPGYIRTTLAEKRHLVAKGDTKMSTLIPPPLALPLRKKRALWSPIRCSPAPTPATGQSCQPRGPAGAASPLGLL